MFATAFASPQNWLAKTGSRPCHTCIKDTSLYSNRRASKTMRHSNYFSASRHGPLQGWYEPHHDMLPPFAMICCKFVGPLCPESGKVHTHRPGSSRQPVTVSLLPLLSKERTPRRSALVFSLACSSKVKSTQIFLNSSKQRCPKPTPRFVRGISPISKRWKQRMVATFNRTYRPQAKQLLGLKSKHGARSWDSLNTCILAKIVQVYLLGHDDASQLSKLPLF